MLYCMNVRCIPFLLNPLLTGSIVTCPDPEPLENDPGVDYRLCNNRTAVCTDNAVSGLTVACLY